MHAILKSFAQEFRSSSIYDFSDRRSYLLKSLLFLTSFTFVYKIFLFLLIDYDVFFIVNEYPIVTTSLFGSFVASYLLSRWFKFNVFLLIPSLACTIISMTLLFEAKEKTNDSIDWIALQILGTIFASYIGTLKCNVVYFAFNLLLTGLILHLGDFSSIQYYYSSYHIVVACGLMCIFFAYKSSVDKRNQRENLTNLLLLQDASELGTWSWNLEDNKVYYDQRWCSILGYERNELEQEISTWNRLIHPNDKSRSLEAVAAYLENKSSVYEVKFKMLHKNGHWVPIIAKGKVTKRDLDGKPLFFSGTHFDYSNFEKLERQNRELSVLVDHMQSMAKIGGWELDLEKDKLKWTEQVYLIHEILPDTAVYKDNCLGFYAAHEQPRITKYVEDCIHHGQAYDDEFELITEKGKHIWVRTTGEPVYDNKKVVRIRGTFQDITDRKMAQLELEKKRAQMMQTSKLATLGEMAAGVAHEINNPLAIISGNAFLIVRAKDNPEKVGRLSEKIILSVERITKIITGLKKFSRQSVQLEKKKYLFHHIMTDSLELLQSQIKQSGVRVDYEQDLELEVVGDETQLTQVVVNLVSNAIDANKTTIGNWVKISAIKINDGIEIKVQDSGTGIDNEILESVFNPFFTTKEVGKGTGLGLSISKGIIEDHGGKLEYHLLDGHTTFLVTLPSSLDN